MDLFLCITHAFTFISVRRASIVQSFLDLSCGMVAACSLCCHSHSRTSRDTARSSLSLLLHHTLNIVDSSLNILLHGRFSTLNLWLTLLFLVILIYLYGVCEVMLLIYYYFVIILSGIVGYSLLMLFAFIHLTYNLAHYLS